jgi:membrane protease YdiL (CAAX protease family)
MDDLVTVAAYDSLPMAEIARTQLIEEGIDAFLADANTVAIYSFLAVAVGGIKLQVRAEDAELAMSILSVRNVTPSDDGLVDSLEPIRFRCTECAGLLEFPAARRGGVETCIHCGRYVDVPESTDITLQADQTPLAGQTASMPPTRRTMPLWLEILAVLSFVYLPHMFSSVANYVWTEGVVIEFALLIVMSIQIIVPLLMLIALLGEGWAKFGIVPVRWLRDFGIGILIWIVISFSAQFCTLVSSGPADPAGLTVPAGSADESLLTETLSPEPYISSWPIAALCFVALLANSLAEELAMRGYLLTRLIELLGRRWLAVAISAGLFGSYHLYQGAANAVIIGIEGVIFAIFFLITKRLWPLVIAHTLINLVHYF